MLNNLLIATPIMVLCLFFQAMMVAVAVRYYTRKSQRVTQSAGMLDDIGLLSAIMLIMMLGNFVQIALWASLFVYLGEFSQFSDAVYHSAVNFATLGYGDVVMSDKHKLLGPLEAANGAIMFGVSTAIMMGAIQDMLRKKLPSQKQAGD
jgi:voltage-gated potassium channel Kch